MEPNKVRDWWRKNVSKRCIGYPAGLDCSNRMGWGPLEYLCARCAASYLVARLDWLKGLRQRLHAWESRSNEQPTSSSSSSLGSLDLVIAQYSSWLDVFHRTKLNERLASAEIMFALDLWYNDVITAEEYRERIKLPLKTVQDFLDAHLPQSGAKG